MIERTIYFLLNVCLCEDYMMWEILHMNVTNKLNITAYRQLRFVNGKDLSNLKIKCCYDFMITDLCGCAAYGLGLRPFDCWLRTESRWGPSYSSVVFVMCCVGRGLLDGLINGTKEFEIRRCFLIRYILYYASNNIENALDFLQDYSYLNLSSPEDYSCKNFSLVSSLSCCVMNVLCFEPVKKTSLQTLWSPCVQGSEGPPNAYVMRLTEWIEGVGVLKVACDEILT